MALDLGFYRWAMGDLNPRPLPCEGRPGSPPLMHQTAVCPVVAGNDVFHSPSSSRFSFSFLRWACGPGPTAGITARVYLQSMDLAEMIDQHPPRRLEVPSWASSTSSDVIDADSLLGGQAEWNHAVPFVFRFLASPATELLPTPPRIGDPMHVGLGYWTPLLHVLLYSLGWAHPDHGLRWWYDAGKPTEDDPRLRLRGHGHDGADRPPSPDSLGVRVRVVRRWRPSIRSQS